MLLELDEDEFLQVAEIMAAMPTPVNCGLSNR